MKSIVSRVFKALLLTAFLSCNNNPQPKTDQQDAAVPMQDTMPAHVRMQGKVIAKAGFQALSGALVKAIETGGVPHALDFCNVKALPITDSVAASFNVKVARVSDKNRNPENAATEQQKQIMEAMRAQIAAAGSARDTVVRLNDKELSYYAPIVIAAPCLQCHGLPGSEVKDDHHQLIQKLYPDDKATAYALGELRGMWYLRFRQ